MPKYLAYNPDGTLASFGENVESEAVRFVKPDGEHVSGNLQLAQNASGLDFKEVSVEQYEAGAQALKDKWEVEAAALKKAEEDRIEAEKKAAAEKLAEASKENGTEVGTEAK